MIGHRRSRGKSMAAAVLLALSMMGFGRQPPRIGAFDPYSIASSTKPLAKRRKPTIEERKNRARAETVAERRAAQKRERRAAALLALAAKGAIGAVS